jgi:hypothetical protein
MTTAIISDYLEAALLSHVLRNTAYTSPGASVYVALHIADPTDAGNGAEVTYTNYARVQVTSWDAPSARATANTAQIDFPTPGGDGDSDVTHVGVWDADLNGNLLFYGALSTAKSIQDGIDFSIAAGDLDISLTGAVSTYLGNALLSHVLRNTAYTTPGTSIYVGLSTTQDEDEGGAEVTGNNYSRVQVTSWDAPSATGGDTENSSTISLPTPSGTWGTPDSTDIWDAATNGNLLFFGTHSGGGAIGADDVISFAAGALDVTIA